MKKTFISLENIDCHIDDWLAQRADFNHQPSSIEAGRKDLRLFSRYCHRARWFRIYGETILKYINWLKVERNNGSGAINRKCSSLRSFIKHLRFLDVKGARAFPIEYLPRARHSYPGPVKTLEPEEVDMILRAIDTSHAIGYRNFTFFNMQYALGLRIGEVVRINVQDIDWKKKEITIHGKGRRERVLPLVDPLWCIMRKYLKHRGLFRNSLSNEAFFISKKGNRLSDRTAQEYFNKLVNEIGPFSIDKVVPHTLRHAFASHALETEQDLLIVKHALGHAAMKSTEVYLHPSMKMLRKSLYNHLSMDTLVISSNRNMHGSRIQAVRASPAAAQAGA